MTTISKLVAKAGRLTVRFLRAGLHRTLLKIGWRAGRKLCWLLAVSLLLMVVHFMTSRSPLPLITNPYLHPRSAGQSQKLQELHLSEKEDQDGDTVHMFAFRPRPGEQLVFPSSSTIPPAGHPLDSEVQRGGSRGRDQRIDPPSLPPQPAKLKKTAGEESRGPQNPDNTVDAVKGQFHGRAAPEHPPEARAGRGPARLEPLAGLGDVATKMKRHPQRDVRPEHLGPAGEEAMRRRPPKPARDEHAGEGLARPPQRSPVQDSKGRRAHAPVPVKDRSGVQELMKKPPAPVGAPNQATEKQRRPPQPVSAEGPGTALQTDNKRKMQQRLGQEEDSRQKMAQFQKRVMPSEEPSRDRQETGRESHHPQVHQRGQQMLQQPLQRPVSLKEPGTGTRAGEVQRLPAGDDPDKPRKTKNRRSRGPEEAERVRKDASLAAQKGSPAEDPGRGGRAMGRASPRRAEEDDLEGKEVPRPQRAREGADGDPGTQPSGQLPAEAVPVVSSEDGLLYLLQGETRPPRSHHNTSWTKKGCLPHRHVFFAKVHKTGSSTVANILQRFGFAQGLNFVMPRKRMHSGSYNYLSLPGQTLTRNDLVPPPRGESYDMLWNHAIYDRQFFRQLMPPDTVFISILRHPLSQFVSTFEFYSRAVGDRMNEFMHMNVSNPLSLYLQSPLQYAWLGGNLSYVRNKQAQDLGMNVSHLNNATLRLQYLQQLDKDFRWVMITEFFDESLVMLKRLLCWDIKDILYIPKNKTPGKKKRKFTAAEKESHQKLNQADYDLYNFFLKRLKNTLKSQPADFQEEVTYFQALQEAVQWQCSRVGKETTMVVTQSQWNPEFRIERRDCRLLQKHELVFMDILFVDAVRRYQKSIQKKGWS